MTNDLVTTYQQIVLDELRLITEKQRLLANTISSYCEKYQTDTVCIQPIILKLKSQDLGVEIVAITISDNGNLLFFDSANNSYDENSIDFSPLILTKQIFKEL